MGKLIVFVVLFLGRVELFWVEAEGFGGVFSAPSLESIELCIFGVSVLFCMYTDLRKLKLYTWVQTSLLFVAIS